MNQLSWNFYDYRICYHRRQRMNRLLNIFKSCWRSWRNLIWMMKKLWKIRSMMSWETPLRWFSPILKKLKCHLVLRKSPSNNLSGNFLSLSHISVQLTIVSIILLVVVKWSKNFYRVSVDYLYLSLGRLLLSQSHKRSSLSRSKTGFGQERVVSRLISFVTVLRRLCWIYVILRSECRRWR